MPRVEIVSDGGNNYKIEQNCRPRVDYWKGTIWQRITQDRQLLKRHVDAFDQPRDTMIMVMMIYLK